MADLCALRHEPWPSASAGFVMELQHFPMIRTPVIARQQKSVRVRMRDVRLLWNP